MKNKLKQLTKKFFNDNPEALNLFCDLSVVASTFVAQKMELLLKNVLELKGLDPNADFQPKLIRELNEAVMACDKANTLDANEKISAEPFINRILKFRDQREMPKEPLYVVKEKPKKRRNRVCKNKLCKCHNKN